MAPADGARGAIRVPAAAAVGGACWPSQVSPGREADRRLHFHHAGASSGAVGAGSQPLAAGAEPEPPGQKWQLPRDRSRCWSRLAGAAGEDPEGPFFPKDHTIPAGTLGRIEGLVEPGDKQAPRGFRPALARASPAETV